MAPNKSIGIALKRPKRSKAAATACLLLVCLKPCVLFTRHIELKKKVGLNMISDLEKTYY